MINTTNTSGCNNKENVKGASFSHNVNTQFNVMCVLAKFVYPNPPLIWA